jgi:uncharacterized protein (DUF58 family)
MTASIINEAIKEAQQLEIYAKEIYETQLSGIYKSVFKGTGQIFKEIRPYVWGDDLRRLDHKVTARLGKPFLRLYEEEREMNVWIAVDVSRSMQFGLQQTQGEQATRLAAVLSYAALLNHDRCGLILFSDQVKAVIPPGKSKIQFIKMMELLLGQKPDGQTSLTQLSHFVLGTIKKKSLLFLISDFNVPQSDLNLLTTLDLRYEFLPIQIDSGQELKVQKKYLIKDLESGTHTLLSANEEAKNLANSFFTEANIPFLALSTSQPYLPALAQFLNQHALRN